MLRSPVAGCICDVISSLNTKFLQIWSSVTGYGELCAFLQPIRIGEIFWMNNNCYLSPTLLRTLKYIRAGETIFERRKKQPTSRDTTGFLEKWRLSYDCQNSPPIRIRVVLLNGWNKFTFRRRPIRSSIQVWVVSFHSSMELLQLLEFHRRRVAGKTVVASRNVSCFLRQTCLL